VVVEEEDGRGRGGRAPPRRGHRLPQEAPHLPGARGAGQNRYHATAHRRILFRPSPLCVVVLVGLWGSVSRFWRAVIARGGSGCNGSRAAG
jgi:hypothetical protein